MPNVGSLQRKRLYKCTRLLACFVPLFFMVLHHRTRRHLFGPISIATAFLRRVLDMFVHSLFFIANSAQRLLFFLFPWHNCTPFSTLSFKYEVTPILFTRLHVIKCVTVYFTSNHTSPAAPSRVTCISQQPLTGKLKQVPHSSPGRFQLEPPCSSGPQIGATCRPFKL